MFKLIACIFLVFYRTQNVLSCPVECACMKQASIESVTCDNKSLNATDVSRIALQIPFITTKLSFTDNNIELFPSEEFTRFPNLKELNLHGNKLRGIPKPIPQLEKLDLSDNLITSISPGSLFGYDNLQELNIETNKIKMLPGNAFSGLNNARRILLENNEIEFIHKDTFLGLEGLKSLSLEGNKLNNVSDDIFLPLSSITNLYLAKNQFETVSSKLLSHLRTLTFIDLEGNMLEDIEKYAFRGLTLTYLLLSNNKLKYLTKEMFEGVTINDLLTLSGNPLQCDCFLYYALLNFAQNIRLIGACAETDVAVNVILKNNLLNCTQCSLEPCNKNEICRNIANDQTECFCKPGFSGKRCEIYDHCLAKPCLNFGLCANKKDYSTFFCKCKHPFIGQRCEREISCAVNHCQNGGKCIVIDHLAYECECKNGFSGQHCEIKAKPLATQAPSKKSELDITLFVALGCVCLALIIILAIVFFIVRRKRLTREKMLVISSPILGNDCEENT